MEPVGVQEVDPLEGGDLDLGESRQGPWRWICSGPLLRSLDGFRYSMPSLASVPRVSLADPHAVTSLRILQPLVMDLQELPVVRIDGNLSQLS